jgi:acetamidase/formamidase
VSSVSPWAEHGGNLDNKHFGKGCTLYFPVNVPGARTRRRVRGMC